MVTSIPIHLLSLIPAPKAVFKSLVHIMSNFFWGFYDGKPKKKWVAWHNICKLTQEGGIGSRNLGEAQSSLFMHFAWKLLSHQSLWSSFFKVKYTRDQHISFIDLRKGSPFLKSIINSMLQAVNQSTWRIRDGQVFFWRDNWLKFGALLNQIPITSNPNLKVKDCKFQNSWDIELLKNMVGDNKLEEVLECLGTVKEGDNLLIWKPNGDGNFTSKSACDLIHLKGPRLTWNDWLWNCALPKIYSITCWKALNFCLNVDARVRDFGIPIVSKCECHTNGCLEDQDHVLATETIAREIWRRVFLLLGMPFDPLKS